MLKKLPLNSPSQKALLLPLAILGIWLLLIFAFSAQPTLTRSQSWMVIKPIRKSFHVAEFAMLTVILWLAINKIRELKRMTFFNSALIRTSITFLFPLLYAILDETHQYFVPNRQATVTDVLIDTVGICLALGSIWLWHNGRLNFKFWRFAPARSRVPVYPSTRWQVGQK